MVTARDDNYIRALQRPARLSQTPCREQMASAKRLARVDQNNVHISRELQMLKSVVKNEPFHSATRERKSVFVTIRTNSKQHTIREARFEKLNFVTRRNDLRSAGRFRFRGKSRRLASIPARKNSHAFAFCQQTLGDPQNHRGLAGPANRQVPHADHHAIQTTLPKNFSGVCSRAKSRHSAVK
jgi:hypothetical protein